MQSATAALLICRGVCPDRRLPLIMIYNDDAMISLHPHPEKEGGGGEETESTPERYCHLPNDFFVAYYADIDTETAV